MSDPIFAVFYSKSFNLAEIKSGRFGFEGGRSEVKVIETKTLSPSEYDAFANDFMFAWPWLDGKGGTSTKRRGDEIDDVHHCIAVTAPSRETLYVNPDGRSYARYVGIII